MTTFNFWSTIICWKLTEVSAQFASFPNTLNGQHLRVVWPLWKGNPEGLIGPLKGGVVIDYLSARLNFTYEMVRVTESNHEATANGKGVFSLFYENKADFLVDLVIPLSERLKIIDLTQPWVFAEFSALIPAPEVLANTNAVIKPFEWQVWLSLGISTVIVVFVSNRVYRPSTNYLITKSSNSDVLAGTTKSYVLTRNNKREKKSSGQFLYIFGNLLSQGAHCKCKRLSFRFVSGCWTLAAFVLIQAYNSTLLTYVVLPVSSPLINSVYDIPNTADVKLLVRKNGGLELILTSTNQSIELFKKLLERIKLFPDSRCILRSDCLNSIRPGSRNVYLDGKPYLLDVIKERYERTGKCELQLTKEGFFSYFAVFALQKNSPYTMSINRGIQELHQMGLIDYWDTWFRPMPPKCHIQGERQIRFSNSRNHLSSLSLKHLTGAFVILTIGLMVSSLVFLFELLKLWCQNPIPSKFQNASSTS